jgi:hypothetical protein
MRKEQQDKKRLEALYCKQNTCQAIVNPGCWKYKVMKSVTIPTAIMAVVGLAEQHWDSDIDQLKSHLRKLPQRKLEIWRSCVKTKV